MKKKEHWYRDPNKDIKFGYQNRVRISQWLEDTKQTTNLLFCYFNRPTIFPTNFMKGIIENSNCIVIYVMTYEFNMKHYKNYECQSKTGPDHINSVLIYHYLFRVATLRAMLSFAGTP